MPRPRAFDEHDVVDGAMRVFWRWGYEATSTDDLCVATGLGRSSLYNAFVGKRALYLRALARYIDDRTGSMLAIIDGAGTARERVVEILARASRPDPDDPPGCFVVNATVEMERDEEVSALLARDRERRVRALSDVIRLGQAAGDVRSDRPSTDLAEFVVATISGLRVAACAGVDAGTLRAIGATALDSI